METDSRLGEVPVRLRVGVTGHRDVAGDDLLDERVREVFDWIRGSAEPDGNGSVALTIVSSLAEGADRVVVEAALATPDADIEAPLPLEPVDYEQDFLTETSRLHFRELLADATWGVVSQQPRPDAYEEASQFVVETSDVVIALWDRNRASLPGGTSATVDYAEQCGAPVIKIEPSGTHAVTWPRLRPEIARYNARRMSHHAFSAAQARARSTLLDSEEPDDENMTALADWIVPYFARADSLASRLQRRYDVFATAVLLFAAGAVSLAAAQAIFWLESPQLAWIEFGLILGGLLLVFIGARQRIQGRWLAYRSLAERLRTALYLAAAGIGDAPSDAVEGSDLGEPSERWVVNAVREVWKARPARRAVQDRERLRALLSRQWVDGQLRYYEGARARSRDREKRVQRGVAAIVIAVAATVIVHAAGWLENGNWPKALALIAIVLPVVGGAIAAIGEQREWRRHGRRYAHIIQNLKALNRRLARAQTIGDLQTLALEVDAIIRDERRDWFGTMLFKNIRVTP